MRNHRLRVAAMLAVTSAIGAGATDPAFAAAGWDYGLPEQDLEQTCQSIGGGGGYFEEVGTSTRTGMHVDRQAVPRVGEVFYGGVMIAAVGGCSDKSVIPEVVPPLGVELAISPAHPVRCHYTLPDGSDTQIVDSCPQSPQPGTQGGLSLAPGGDPSNAWVGIGKIPGTPALSRPRLEILYIEFPLRAARPLHGLPGGPSCAAHTLHTGPCPRASAGDFLQVATQVFALGDAPVLASAIGLVVAPAGAATGGGGASAPVSTGGSGHDRTSLLTAPRSLRIRRALKGIPFTVSVLAGGARVTATLSARRIGRIASTRRLGVPAGALQLRLKPTRAAARKLRRRRATVAILRVRISIPGRPAAVESARIRLRR